MEKHPRETHPQGEIRPEYSLSPDDDLFGSPRSWTGFYALDESPAPKSDEQKRGKKRNHKRRSHPRAPVHEDTESPILQRFMIQAVGAAALFFSVWMFFHSDRPFAKTVQAVVNTAMKTDYSTIVLPPAVARNFGILPSSAVTVLATAAKKTNFIQPLAGAVIRPFALVNPEVIIKGRPGSQVAASADGLVVKVGESQASGNFVVIDHGNDGQTFYANLGTVFVRPQEYVVAGQIIGMLPAKSGELTFGYINKGAYRNPLMLFQPVK